MLQRHVYQIIVVKHSDGGIIGSPTLVATSSEAAMAKADLPKICTDAGLQPDDVEYVILKLGSLRPIEEVVQTEVKRW